MTKLRSLALAAASAIVLAACATATPYQSASQPGAFDGYSQTLLQNDRARISFGGNSLTDRETVETYLLYRAAEMALERGFDHFTLAERDTEERTRQQVSPGLRSSYRSGLYDPYFGYSFYRPRYGWSAFHPYSRFGFYSPYYRRPRVGLSVGFGSPYYNRYRDPFYDPFFRDYDVREVTKYRATAEATFGYGPAPDAANAFDAREVVANLGPTIRAPKH